MHVSSFCVSLVSLLVAVVFSSCYVDVFSCVVDPQESQSCLKHGRMQIYVNASFGHGVTHARHFCAFTMEYVLLKLVVSAARVCPGRVVLCVALFYD